MSDHLRGLPKIGPSTVVPVRRGDVPDLRGWILVAYSLASKRWCLYNHGCVYGSLEAALDAARDLPSVYVHAHVLGVEISGGAIEVGEGAG